jgi:glycyl-tRNA synthetase beta chain
MRASLLVEILCEELPPKALPLLGSGFAKLIVQGLSARSFLGGADHRWYATPRRLAVLIPEVPDKAPDQEFTERLMPVSVGFDADGNATAALTKKLAAKQLSHVHVRELKRVVEGKVEQLFYSGIAKGQSLMPALQSALEEAIEGLPIPKVMSYQLADGVTTVSFVRPAHALVALHGSEVVPVSALGLEAGRSTQGHRFQGAATIRLASSDHYERVLEVEGGVIASFEQRRAAILAGLESQAEKLGVTLGRVADYAALLDEVTALVEMPTVYAGTFEQDFLAVPPECLTLTMRQNQKYFPLFDAKGKLTNRFLIVSNMRLDDPVHVVQGNERVIRPRLADARFFFETDKQTRLADRVAQLASRTYHNKLGTDLERVERLRRLASRIQGMLPRGEKGRPYADRAAFLAKADLVTLMVGEFPELQGIMGKHYAEADGEEPSVVRAIEQHYWPRFSGDELPSGDVSVALALADKLETLVGIWGVGQQPTGDKDPFGLRRAALGVLRILSEKPETESLDLGQLLESAFSGFPAGKLALDTATQVHSFMLDRLRSLLREKGYDANEIEAVLVDNPTRIREVWRRIEAVKAFRALPEAEALAAANKRIQNILRKSDPGSAVDYALLFEPEEKRLHATLTSTVMQLSPLLERGEFESFLKGISKLRDPVDAFFDKVLVNADDERLRSARLGLLKDLGAFMNSVADISKLAS